MKTIAVIMAGGRGERFWPRSRVNRPKQFLSLTDDGKTMLQLAAERLQPLVAYEDQYIVSSKDYVELIKNQLPQIPSENIICEPMSKSTAPCIGLAATILSKKYGEAVMLVLPSDHLIEDSEQYIAALLKAIEKAKIEDNLVTIGIRPTYPETGYGYICFEPGNQSGAYPVKRFVEKPDKETAKAYLESDQYLWNSGMFIWKLSSIMKRFKELLPDIYGGLQFIKDAWDTPSYERVLTECFMSFKSDSIDYGIMERANHIFTIPANFGWDDAGSWLVFDRMNKTDKKGNITRGDVLMFDSENSIIIGCNKMIAVVGVKDLVVVDTDDVILICEKSNTQNVREIIKQLKASNRIEFL